MEGRAQRCIQAETVAVNRVSGQRLTAPFNDHPTPTPPQYPGRISLLSVGCPPIDWGDQWRDVINHGPGYPPPRRAFFNRASTFCLPLISGAFISEPATIYPVIIFHQGYLIRPFTISHLRAVVISFSIQPPITSHVGLKKTILSSYWLACRI